MDLIQDFAVGNTWINGGVARESRARPAVLHSHRSLPRGVRAGSPWPIGVLI